VSSWQDQGDARAPALGRVYDSQVDTPYFFVFLITSELGHNVRPPCYNSDIHRKKVIMNLDEFRAHIEAQREASKMSALSAIINSTQKEGNK
jgi:hypothetical protein